MLWLIFVVLLVMWLLGMVSGTTLGGFLHILLIIDVVESIIGRSEHVAEFVQAARQFSVGGDECIAPAVHMVEELGT